MNNKCINLSQKFNKKLYCKKYKKDISISQCSNCKYKKFKNAQYKYKSCEKIAKTHNKSQNTVQIKKRTYKLAKLEKNRFSIITNDLDHCIICGKKKDNLHEVFAGRNRLNSIKFGIVIPLCLKHHQEIHKNKDLWDIYHKKGQAIFNNAYPNLDFLDVFKKNYL